MKPMPILTASWVPVPDVTLCLMSRADKAASIYDMRWWVPRGRIGSTISPDRGRGIPDRGSTWYQGRKMRVFLFDVSETSARSWSIRRDVAFFEVAPIPQPGAGSTDRHWGCQDFGDAEGRTSGDAMWRWWWVTTLLYTSVCTRGWHHAGAGTSPARVRNGRRRTRGPDRVSTWGCPLHCCASAAWVRQARWERDKLEEFCLPFSIKDNYSFVSLLVRFVWG